jgi:hypothetical protein
MRVLVDVVIVVALCCVHVPPYACCCVENLSSLWVMQVEVRTVDVPMMATGSLRDCTYSAASDLLYPTLISRRRFADLFCSDGDWHDDIRHVHWDVFGVYAIDRLGGVDCTGELGFDGRVIRFVDWVRPGAFHDRLVGGIVSMDARRHVVAFRRSDNGVFVFDAMAMGAQSMVVLDTPIPVCRYPSRPNRLLSATIELVIAAPRPEGYFAADGSAGNPVIDLT